MYQFSARIAGEIHSFSSFVIVARQNVGLSRWTSVHTPADDDRLEANINYTVLRPMCVYPIA